MSAMSRPSWSPVKRPGQEAPLIVRITAPLDPSKMRTLPASSPAVASKGAATAYSDTPSVPQSPSWVTALP